MPGWFRSTRRSTDDFAEEVRAHLALETERLIAEGLPPDEARFAARRAFGNVTAATERFHDSQRAPWLDQARQDLRTGFRNLSRYPVAALVAVLSLGLGIGATTASLTIRDVIFRNPPPLYAQPAQLSKVQVNRRDRPIYPVGSLVPGDLYTAWRDATGLTMAATIPPRGQRDVRVGDRLETAAVRAVTANFFELLGVGPAMGRVFSARTADRTGPGEAVLSARLWQQWFEARGDAVGSAIWIDQQPYTVIGVMPAAFWFADNAPSVWTLANPNVLSRADEVQMVVRRTGGMRAEELAARLRVGLDDYSSRLPAGEGPLQLRVSEVKGTPMGDQISLLLPYVLATSVVLTLLIACANVAILMIAQWTRRETETAVRAALGASRGRLVRGLLAESVLLASGAGMLGVAATFAVRGLIISNATVDLSFLDLSIHPAVLAQTAVVTLVTGILAGLGPALFETRRLQTDPLRGIATSDRVRQRWSHALVVLEITVTFALLVVTSSMVQGVQRSMRAEMGFDLDRLIVATVQDLRGLSADTLTAKLRGMPGVASVAAATSIPLGGRGLLAPVSANPTGANGIRAEHVEIGAEFFRTLGVAMRAGRPFTRDDTPRTRTAIVNEALARQFFGGVTPVGRQLWVGGRAFDIVGVVADYASNPVEARVIRPRLFTPLTTEPAALKNVRLLIRSAAEPGALVQPVRRALLDVLPGGQVTATYTFRDILTVQAKEMLAGTAPLVPLIGIGMLLTAAGIYGVLAFAIARRSRELAVRVAIGASRRQQVQLVIQHSLRLLALGTTVGIGVTFGLSRIVRAAGGAGSLYDPSWTAFLVPLGIVLVVGALATWIPTRRALRISPSLLLRAQ